MKKYIINKKILQFNYFELHNYISEFKENLTVYSNKDIIKKRKKQLFILVRYLNKIKKQNKIETLTEMKNRKLDKHIKGGNNE